ncbi:MAG: ATP-binding cassette domain-containing protein [Candidatus Schekmanbacteria bacterium]|nr:ATP-binding cassette domain-containing protein [Candidatus Schekmanbacteria bacterium]
MGLMRPDSGEVWIGDQDIASLSGAALLDVRRNMGMVFQNYALFDSMTVYENVGFALIEYSRLTPSEIRKEVTAMLQAVDLSPSIADLKPSQLSGGMKKRVGIARALIHRPRVVLYDDPTGGLDPVTSDVINELILTLNRKHEVASLAVSNDMHTARKIGTRLAMLYGGKILATGTPQEIMASEHPYVRQFVEGREDGPIQYV